MGHKAPSIAKLIAGITALVASTLCFAQATSGSGVAAATANDTCRNRILPVTLLREAPDSDLKLNELQVFVDGRAVPVTSLLRTSLSPRVILLLDTSGSMADAFGPKWTNTLLAAQFALNAIPPQSPTALVTFSEQSQVSGFGTPQEILQKVVALRKTKPHGRTALYEAIRRSLDLFGAAQFGDTIYIISDAGDDYGPEKRTEVAGELIQRGIRAFAFAVQEPFGSPLTPEERNGPNQLFEFIKLTGGDYISPPVTARWMASSEHADMVRIVRSQLQSPYRIQLQLPVSPSKPAKLKLVAASKKLQLGYPQRVEPCSLLTSSARP